MTDVEQLLIDISHCPVAAAVRSGQVGCDPCQNIIRSQKASTFQLPEPWSGRIDVAPILFLSSNPSIDELEMYPDSSWEPNQVIDFFQNRFSSPSRWVTRLCALRKDGTRTRWVKFWAAARARVSEILEKPKAEIRPGIDFALTEVVHCKSRKEVGVKDARSFCSNLYLERVLSIAAANTIIVFGEHAKQTVRDRYSDAEIKWHIPGRVGEFTIANRTRILVFLPAPNAYGPEKTLDAQIGREGLLFLRCYFQEQTKPSRT